MSLTPFSFVDGALDRADHLRDDPAALAALRPVAMLIALDTDGRALATDDRQLHIIAANTMDAALGELAFLGLRDGTAWFYVDAAASGIEAPQRVDLRNAAAHWPAWQASLFAQARALQHWHRSHRFCSACGGSLRYTRAGWLGVCDACGREHYPRTDQAIIAAITDGKRLLLGRQANWPARRWSVVAGFVEPGETLEQTVAREVMEETGVRVHAHTARYLASQPWPFPGSLMLGFIADAEPDEPVPTDELESARWFSADEVRAGLANDWATAETAGEGIVLSSPISIARHVIHAWLQAHDAREAAIAASSGKGG